MGLAILQDPLGGKSRQAPHHHPQGCSLPAPDCHPGVHVRRRSERCSRSASPVPQNCGEAQGEGACCGSPECEGRVKEEDVQKCISQSCNLVLDSCEISNLNGIFCINSIHVTLVCIIKRQKK